jgi:ketosteroid isomerase-like protein
LNLPHNGLTPVRQETFQIEEINLSQQNVGIVHSLYEAFAKGDVPTVLGAFTPDAEWREADNFPYADGNPYVGPGAILQGVFMRLATEWDGFGAHPAQFLDAGDTVVVTGRYAGAYKATGKSIDAQFAHVWTLANGKVARFQQYADTLQVARAVQKAAGA